MYKPHTPIDLMVHLFNIRFAIPEQNCWLFAEDTSKYILVDEKFRTFITISMNIVFNGQIDI